MLPIKVPVNSGKPWWGSATALSEAKKSFQQLSRTRNEMMPSDFQSLATFLVALPVLLFACQDLASSSSQTTMPLGESRQCLLVVTPSWTSSTGILRAFERSEAGLAWIQRWKEIPVVVGKNGLAWGRGLENVQGRPGPVKKEGDQRAPAGIFRLSSAFGYAPASQASQVKLPYLPLTADSEGINDSASHYYNQLVQRSRIPNPDWRSSEQLRRNDDLYRWGVVVDHNTPPVKDAGSCIFLHVWRGPASGTDGCTAMAEDNLKTLIGWLEPKQNPVLVQLPQEEFELLRRKWQLPQP
jgi:D-alanyl-D-alanine dipeptidase